MRGPDKGYMMTHLRALSVSGDKGHSLTGTKEEGHTYKGNACPVFRR